MMKNIFIAVLLVILPIGGFLLGGNFIKERITRSSDSMQAQITFGHLQMYTALKSDLLSNCKPRLESRLEFIINEQKMLMAGYVQGTVDKQFEDYINLRDKNLIKELKYYEVNWNKKWVLPDCQKQ